MSFLLSRKIWKTLRTWQYHPRSSSGRVDVVYLATLLPEPIRAWRWNGKALLPKTEESRVRTLGLFLTVANVHAVVAVNR